jgi:hypothetical protein
MPDDASHDLLRGAFVDLEEYAMPLATLRGLDHARATVRRRRTVRAVIASAALVAITSAATFALTRGSGHEPNVVTTNPPTSTPEPALPMRLVTDNAKPTPFDQARFDLPDFHHNFCPKGQTQFHDRQWTGPGVAGVFEASALILDVVEGDVTGDQQMERIVLVICNAGTDPGAYAAQVVAYTHTGALLGQVTWVTGGQTGLWGPQVADGKVRVLYESRPNAGPATALQWRSFTWNGSRFAPAGTTAVQFDPQPTQLTATAQLTAFSASDAHATLTVRVANHGARPLDALNITMTSGTPLSVSLAGTELNSMQGQGAGDQYYRWSLTIAGMPPGTTLEGTFDVTAVPKALIGPGRLGVSVWAVGPGGLPLENESDTNIDLLISR